MEEVRVEWTRGEKGDKLLLLISPGGDSETHDVYYTQESWGLNGAKITTILYVSMLWKGVNELFEGNFLPHLNRNLYQPSI